MNAIKVPAKSLAWLTAPAFSSRKREVRVEVKASVRFFNTFWDGGSRNQYRAVRLATGEVATLITGSSPWTAVAEGASVELEPGVAIVEESVFCDKAMPLTVYVHPANVAALLPGRS